MPYVPLAARDVPPASFYTVTKNNADTLPRDMSLRKDAPVVRVISGSPLADTTEAPPVRYQAVISPPASASSTLPTKPLPVGSGPGRPGVPVDRPAGTGPARPGELLYESVWESTSGERAIVSPLASSTRGVDGGGGGALPAGRSTAVPTPTSSLRPVPVTPGGAKTGASSAAPVPTTGSLKTSGAHPVLGVRGDSVTPTDNVIDDDEQPLRTVGPEDGLEELLVEVCLLG